MRCILGCVLVIATMIGCSEPNNTIENGAPNTSSEQSQLRRFIFITNGDDPFWHACNAGLVEGAKRFDLESQGLMVVMETNNGTAQGQIEKLRQLASQPDVAGVAISVIQAENAAIVDEMKNLRAKGVSVITVDGDVNKGLFPDARPYYIGTDNIVGGRLLGRAAKKLLESRGKDSGGYVQFAGFTDNDNARKRMDGFKDSMGERYSELDRMPDEMDLSKARNNVRTALVNHPDLTALVGIWAYNAPAIAEVAEERGVRDQVTVVTFDAQAAAIQHMIDGHIDAMVVQNPFEMGIRTVKLLLAMDQKDDKTIQEMFPRSGEAAGDVHTTGLRLIIPDSDSPLKAEDFEVDGIEFLPLEEFRVWLDTYNLSSS